MEERKYQFTDGTSVDVVSLKDGTKAFFYRPPSPTSHPSKGGSNMTLVRFVGQLNTYGVLVTTNADERSIAQVFKKMGLENQGYSYQRRASELATEFLRVQPNSVLTERKMGTSGENVVTVNVPSLSVSVGGKVAVPMKEFINRDDGIDYQKMVGKVIKFNYKGGSHVGKDRIIKLDKVVGTGKATLLKGWDVVQTTGEKKAFRSYRVTNIVGKVEVLG
jgi:hypothetical protein